jgi:signal transduction histidine kinase
MTAMSRPAVCALLWFPGAASTATEPAVAGMGWGPWLFATVALLLVAVLAGWVGRQVGRAERQRSPVMSPGRTPSPQAKTLPAAAGHPTAGASAPASPADTRKLDDAAAFSYALSHDLRAPLRVVEGFARILKEDYGRQLDRIGNDHLDRMLGASARMNAMIDAMLALAQLSNQPLAREAVDLSQLAQQVIEDLQRTQPQRQVRVTLAPGLHTQGDPVLLRQLMENLLGNAWKYTSKIAQAHITLNERTAEASAGLRVYEIADNGAGFDMRSADRLFGLFQRLHASSEFPGTGLGLASVLRIVRRHGGQIRAESEPGRGARFIFSLPG